MLQPKKTKYRKAHKGRIKGVATSATTLNYGTYGLKALEAERITARQIEAARVAMTRFMKRAGRVWVRIFPDVPVSKKPTEVRMGKGKGSPEFWACRVKPGKILFEVDGVSQAIATEAFGRASSKLPIKTKVVEQLIKQRHMKAEEIRKKTTDQLNTELQNLYKESFNLRFQKSSGQLENTSRIFKVRKLIARIKTIMKEKMVNQYAKENITRNCYQ